MAALPNYRCLRCGFWSYDTPIHGCTPRPFAAAIIAALREKEQAK